MTQIITVLRRIDLRTQDAENVDLLLIMIPQLISLIILKNKTLKNQQKKKKMLAWRLLELQDFSFLMSEAGFPCIMTNEDQFSDYCIQLQLHNKICASVREDVSNKGK